MNYVFKFCHLDPVFSLNLPENHQSMQNLELTMECKLIVVIIYVANISFIEKAVLQSNS